jgi:hypothetical protein
MIDRAPDITIIKPTTSASYSLARIMATQRHQHVDHYTSLGESEENAPKSRPVWERPENVIVLVERHHRRIVYLLGRVG